MALLNLYENELAGLQVQNAYYKTRKDVLVQGDKIIFSVDVFVSQEARQEGKNPLASIEYTAEGLGPISFDENERATQLYGYLKTLPEFENSVDT